MALLVPLIDTATLAAHLDDDRVRIYDATAFLRRELDGGPYTVESGRAAYEAGHIPGAAFADVPGDLSDPDAPWPFTRPSPSRWASATATLGIGAGVHVVVYAQESPMWATRLWWLLRYFGFDDVSVLDGGLTTWRAEGRRLETGDHRHPASVPSVATPRPELLATADEVAGAGAEVCLVNALTAGAFRGDGPGAYSRPGRIPGSVSVPAGALLDPATTRFADPTTLATRFDATVPEGPVIAYCGGGISATVDLFALHLLGREGRLYDGSLTEWSAAPDRPLEVG